MSFFARFFAVLSFLWRLLRVPVLIGIGFAIGFVVPYAAWTAGGRVRRRWNAFELSIGPQTVRCAARGHGRVTIRFDELKRNPTFAAGTFSFTPAKGVDVVGE